jgi:hypothetical protein
VVKGDLKPNAVPDGPPRPPSDLSLSLGVELLPSSVQPRVVELVKVGFGSFSFWFAVFTRLVLGAS